MPQGTSTDLIRVLEQYTLSLNRPVKTKCHLHNRSLLCFFSSPLCLVIPAVHKCLVMLWPSYPHGMHTKHAAGSKRVMGRFWEKELHTKKTEYKLQASLCRNWSTNVSFPAVHVGKIGRWNAWAWNMPNTITLPPKHLDDNSMQTYLFQIHV